MDGPTPGRPPLVVVMGVAGSGKSTVGQALADRLGVDFADASAHTRSVLWHLTVGFSDEWVNRHHPDSLFTWVILAPG